MISALACLLPTPTGIPVASAIRFIISKFPIVPAASTNASAPIASRSVWRASSVAAASRRTVASVSAISSAPPGIRLATVGSVMARRSALRSEARALSRRNLACDSVQ